MTQTNDALIPGRLFIGWAQVDITPDKPVGLQGQFHERLSESVQSPLKATILALETRDEQGQVLDQLVTGSVDLCVIHAETLQALKKRLAGRLTDLDSTKVLLHATHIHTGPATQDLSITTLVEKYVPAEILPDSIIRNNPGVMQHDVYRAFLLDQLEEGCVRAWQERAPGFIGQALGHAVLSYNRRAVYDDGSALMYGSTDTINFLEIEGPEDHGVELMYFWDEQGSLTGILVNTASPAQVVGSKYYISADYWGEARRLLDEAGYGQVFLLPQCSAAGDQCPIDLIRRDRCEPEMRDIGGAIELGRRVVAVVFDRLAEAEKRRTDQVVLAHQVLQLNLPLRTVSQREAETARNEIRALVAKKMPGETITSEERRNLHIWGGYLDRYEVQQQTSFYTPEIHLARIGDAAMATSPFELFLNYGQQIKARSKAKQTFVVQLACDCGMYLPTQKAIDGGHYSAILASGSVGPEGGRILVNQSVEGINSFFSSALMSSL